MDTLLKENRTKRTAYSRLLVRLLLALLAAHLIVSYGQKENLFELLVLDYYYPALGCSFVMAVIIIETISEFDRYLNKKHPWQTAPIIRAAWQILACIIFPLAMSVAMAFGYFRYYHINISDTIYFQYYFMVITFMIIALNLLYTLIYIIKLHFNSDQLIIDMPSTATPDMDEPVVVETETIAENPEVASGEDNEIALIYSDSRDLFAKTIKGETVLWTSPLGKAIKELPGELYFKIDRDCIVRRDVIKRVVQKSARKLELELTAPFVKKWKVSSRKNSAFKAWWGGEVYISKIHEEG